MLYEGGIRVPLIVRWPGQVAPGAVSDHVSAFWDFMPTLADIAGAARPMQTDGISMVPVLTGDAAAQSIHERLYWEYHGGQALVSGQWKAVRPQTEAPLELYDLTADPTESTDVSASHPDVVQRLLGEMDSARTPSAFFPLDRTKAARLGRVRRACGLISASAREVLRAAPETGVDPGGPGAPDPTCTVALRLGTNDVPAGAEPSQAVRGAFEAALWEDDPGATADGAGTTAFAYSRDDVRCEVSAGCPAGLVEGEIVEDGTVYLEASCYASD